MRANRQFEVASAQLEEAYAMRQRAMVEAFAILEEHLQDFSRMLISSLGDRSRAARWMSVHHRAFDGRNAYQVIADGELDRLWDEIVRRGGSEE